MHLFRRIAWVAAILMTIAAVWLHFWSFAHAGGLWRDEVSTANIALLPTLGQVWEALPHDSYPVVFPVLVRLWGTAGIGATDVGFRLLGLVCGLLLLASFWVASRTMDKGLPLLSLALAGLNVTVLRYGDSIRAYGLGTACILLTVPLIWRFTQAPSLRRGLPAGMAAVLSVQALYQNAVFVLALCIAGAVVCVRRGQRREVVGILGIGLAAALSLLPCVNPIHHAQSWWIVEKMGIHWSGFYRQINEATGMQTVLWFVLVIIAALFGIGFGLRNPAQKGTPVQEDLPLFAGLALVVGLAGFWFFLQLAGLPTQSWYYIPAMGFAVICCDTILPRIHHAMRIGVLMIAIIVALMACPAAISPLKCRQTNGDLVAAQVSRYAAPGDLIIVHPWFNGITFARYYRGIAPWTTLPPLADYRFHRYDLLKSKLQMTDAIASVLEQTKAVLQSGHCVWFVGQIPRLPRDTPPPHVLPPAPYGLRGWSDDPYTVSWGERFSYFLLQHITNAVPFVDPSTNHVNPLENMELIANRGWR
jgi:hypothetical protein